MSQVLPLPQKHLYFEEFAYHLSPLVEKRKKRIFSLILSLSIVNEGGPGVRLYSNIEEY
jgi:hypothetical protein